MKQGTPEGRFSWLAVSDIVWTEVSRSAHKRYHYESRCGQLIGAPLLAFVDDGIYLNASHEGRRRVLDGTSRLHKLNGFSKRR